MTAEATSATAEAPGGAMAGEPRDAAWRIMVAYDLSPASDVAIDLVASAAWPPSTVIRIVTNAVGVGPMISSFALLQERRAHASTVRQMIGEAHDRVAALVASPGVAIESRTLRGRPGRSIVAEAGRFDAHLIVAGARIQGAIASTLLGSVSREIVENARCSVLVTRARGLANVLLATDGSTAAQAGARIVATSPLFLDARVRVIAIGDHPPEHPDTEIPVAGRGAGAFSTAVRRGRTTAAALDQAVDELAAHGRDVDAEVRHGDAATEIVRAAREWLPDVVVIGSNGQSLLRRVLLGSVARKVIDGVHSSVLVAKPQRARQPSQAAPERSAGGS